MEISATVKNTEGTHEVAVRKGSIEQALSVSSPASAEEIAELIRQTDAVAEVHNTVRLGVPVNLIP